MKTVIHVVDWSIWGNSGKDFIKIKLDIGEGKTTQSLIDISFFKDMDVVISPLSSEEVVVYELVLYFSSHGTMRKLNFINKDILNNLTSSLVDNVLNSYIDEPLVLNSQNYSISSLPSKTTKTYKPPPYKSLLTPKILKKHTHTNSKLKLKKPKTTATNIKHKIKIKKSVFHKKAKKAPTNAPDPEINTPLLPLSDEVISDIQGVTVTSPPKPELTEKVLYSTYDPKEFPKDTAKIITFK